MAHRLSPFRVGNVSVGGPAGHFLIAGPCVLENLDRTRRIAERAREISSRHGFGLVFKSSFDKANRSSVESYRGPGLDKGLSWLARIKDELGLPILADVHEVYQVAPVAEVADCVQIPAFLCRQTDLLIAAAKSGRAVNIKKGQFMAPWDMENAVAKVRSCGCDRVLVTERGFSLGYNNLVVDFRSLPILSRLAHVVFDGTHSVQLPGGLGRASGGERDMVPVLVRAAVAVGCAGLFLEVHEDPDQSPSDGPNMLSLEALDRLLGTVRRIAEAVQPAPEVAGPA